MPTQIPEIQKAAAAKNSLSALREKALESMKKAGEKALSAMEKALEEGAATIPPAMEELEPIAREIEKEINKELEPIVERLKEKLEPPSKKASPDDPDSPLPPLRTPEVEHQSEASVSQKPIKNPNWFLHPQEYEYVHFGAKAGNQILPLPDSESVFSAIANAIHGAQKSIDIITWGLDTDMRLRRAGNPAEYYRTQNYISDKKAAPHKGFYPAHQDPLPPFDDWGASIAGGSRPPGGGADPDPENSWVFADLLTRVAQRGVKVRLLVWEPFYGAKNVLDPLHFWFRCKTGIIPNIEFAFRKFAGQKPVKPARPQLFITKDSGEKELYKDGLMEKLEERVDRLISNEQVYNLLYTHHQKEIIVDLDAPEKAVGFIVGCNIKEEYWDSSDHKAVDPFRRPYGPWSDAGVQVRGPVLHDMAKNFREGWEHTLSVGSDPFEDEFSTWLNNLFNPWSTGTFFEGGTGAAAERAVRRALDLTNEAFPTSLIGAALTAGVSPQSVYNGSVLKKFKVNSYARVVNLNEHLQISPPEAWEYRLAPQCMELCAFLTAMAELVGGIMSGGFDVTGMLRPAADWNGNVGSPESFPTDPESPTHTAQFLRTYSLKDKPKKDFSIRAAYSRALHSVDDGGMIYIENQYFRDPYFADEVVKLADKGVKPHIIIVTNPISNEKGEYLNPTEGQLAEEPTYIAYRMLKEGGVPFCFCWLRTMEKDPPVYKEPRGPSIVSGIVDLLQPLGAGGLDFEGLFNKIIIARNKLFEEIYPVLLAHDASGMNRLEQFDDAYNARIQKAIQDFQVIRDSFANLKLHIDAFDDVIDMLKKSGHDLALQVAKSQADNFLSALDQAIEKVHTTIDTMESTAKSAAIQGRIGLTLDRWLYNMGDFLGFYKNPQPYEEKEPYLSFIYEMMQKYNKLKKPPPARPNVLPGHIYVHSKVMIVDEAFAIVGSANINERSMWHDTEVALGFRADNRASAPRDLQRSLFGSILNKRMPEQWNGQAVYKHFEELLGKNNERYDNGKPDSDLLAHILSFTPTSRDIGSFAIS